METATSFTWSWLIYIPFWNTAMLLFRCLHQSSDEKHLSQAQTITSGIQNIIVETVYNSKPHSSLCLFFFFCICLTLSLTVKDNNYYFCRFLTESLKSVLSSWYALHIFNYIKVIKQNSVPFSQTHVFISLLIKSKPNSKSKMDQNLSFLFLFFF